MQIWSFNKKRLIHFALTTNSKFAFAKNHFPRAKMVLICHLYKLALIQAIFGSTK